MRLKYPERAVCSIAEEPVAVLNGPRPVGKSTLLSQPAGHLGRAVIDRDDLATYYLGGSTSNAGCFGAMARICSSLESGPVPSKKIPTSAFHLLR